jgi:hypothetical protein
MTLTRTIRWWLVPVVFLLAVSPATAQSPWSVSAGYQALHLPDNWAGAGVNVDVSFDRTDALSFVGEFGLVHDGDDADAPDPHDFNIFNVGGGARWSHRGLAVVPFLQVLAGIQISDSDTDSDAAFMIQPGAGILVPISERWGASAQFDYRPAFYQEDVVQQFRFVAGVRWSAP